MENSYEEPWGEINLEENLAQSNQESNARNEIDVALSQNMCLIDATYTNGEKICYLDRMLYNLGYRDQLNNHDLGKAYYKLSGQPMSIPSYKDPPKLSELGAEHFANAQANSITLELQQYVLRYKSFWKSLDESRKDQVSKISHSLAEHLSRLPTPKGAWSNFGLVVLNIVNRLVTSSTDDNISAEDVYTELCSNNPAYANWLFYNKEGTLSYAESILNIFGNEIMMKKSNDLQSKKDNYTTILLADEAKVISTINQLNKQQRVGLMEQIVISSDFEFSTVCKHCGKKIVIKSPIIEFLRFTRSKGIFAIPIPVQCECGYSMMMNWPDLATTITLVTKMDNENLKKQNENVDYLCKVSTVSKVKLSPAGVYRYWSKMENQQIGYNFDFELSLFKSVNYETDDKTTISSNTSVNSYKPACTREEYRCASDEFYNHLITFKSADKEVNYVRNNLAMELFINDDTVKYTENSKRLSWKALAALVTKAIGINYKKAKLQAVFSLLSALNNPVFKYLDCREIWGIEKSIDEIQHMVRYNSVLIERDAINDLLIMYHQCTGENIEISDNEFIKDKQLSGKVLETLKRKIEKMRKDAESFAKMRKDAIRCVKLCKDALSYVKIISLNNYSLSDFLAVVTDDEMFNLVDELSDRMIITNYASKFYNSNLICTGNNNNNTKVAMERSISIDDLESNACKFIDNYLKDFFDTDMAIASIKASKVEHYLPLFQDTSLNSFYYAEKFISCAMKYDLHGMVKSYRDLYEVKSSQVDLGFYNTYNDAVENLEAIREYDKGASSSVEYVLMDAGFSKEEIDEAEYMYGIYPKQKIPRRKNGEGIDEYIARYHEDTDDFIDYGEVIERFRSELAVIYAASKLYTIDYDDFFKSAYVVNIIRFCALYAPIEKALKLLGVGESFYKTLVQDIYKINVKYSGEFAECVLLGNYHSQLNELVYDLAEEYRNAFLNTDTDIDKYFDFSNQKEWLDSIIFSINESEQPINYTKDGKDAVLTDYDSAEMIDEYNIRKEKYCKE